MAIKSKKEIKKLLSLQAQGLKEAYYNDLVNLDTPSAIKNLLGIFALIPSEKPKTTSGLVELQKYFRGFVRVID